MMGLIEYSGKIIERKNAAASRASALAIEVIKNGSKLDVQDLAIRLQRLANEISDITSPDSNVEWK